MLGWFKADAARASRRKRSSTCGSFAALYCPFRAGSPSRRFHREIRRLHAGETVPNLRIQQPPLRIVATL